MQGVTNALLNLILVSIPEETFLVVMTLILLKRFDMLDIRMWRYNIRWLVIPVLPVAILINVFRYIIIIPKPFVSLITLILINLLMVYVIRKTSIEINKRLIRKTVFFMLICFSILIISEIIYIPITLLLMKKDISYFNNVVIYNFILSIPSRATQYSIIIYTIFNKNSKIHTNTIFINYLLKNKFLRTSSIVLIIMFDLSTIYFLKLIVINNILSTLGLYEQMIIIIIILSLPVITLTWFVMLIKYLIGQERQIQQTYENLVMQDDISFDVED